MYSANYVKIATVRARLSNCLPFATGIPPQLYVKWEKLTFPKQMNQPVTHRVLF